MPRMMLFALLLPGLLLATSAHAARGGAPGPEAQHAWPHRTELHADRQIELDQGPAWQGFKARHGAWRAMWNERAETPSLATGPGIRLAARLEDREGVDRALRDFITSNPGIFRAASRDLETVRVQRAGSVWYASYRRRADGVPVLFERWEFRVGGPARLMAFGVDARPLDAGMKAAPAIDASAARDAARADLRLGPSARIEGGDNLYWLPEEGSGGPTYRLVREVRARATTPPASWIVLVDAADGAVRWRHDRLRFDIAGQVNGPVHLGLPTGPTQPQPFPHQRVSVGGNHVFADAAGIYTSPATGTVTVESALEGLFCDVYRSDDADAAFSTTATEPGLAHITWSDANSHQGERDAYFHINLAHDHLKSIDPGFTGNDYPMPCVVNIPDYCNAFWDGFSVNFYGEGGGCPNIATMPDVVYHEYGHGVNDNLYVQAGSPFGMFNGALHEGLADVTAAFVQDTPIFGKGFFGPGTALRSAENSARWPEDASSDPHITGLIVAGAMWDLRESIGLTLAERLGHFAKYGVPDDANDGMAMGRYFTEVLIADDNDGDLANGTPHFDQIATAFGAHGIGTGVFISMAHVPLVDQPTPSPYSIQCQIAYSGPFGGLDPASPCIRYSVNDSPIGTTPLTSIGGSDYVGAIPAPARSIVRYYLSVSDQHGDSRTLPRNAEQPIAFLAGPTTTHMLHDHEANAGWIPGEPQDDAVSGRWQWVAPIGSTLGNQQVQTDADHTPTGILCYVTQNPIMDFSPGAHDVDNGRTTLFTSTFDALAAGPDALIEYYRWYTNNLGAAPGSDLWRVDISNDGGLSYVPVESTPLSDNSWKRVVFYVKDFLPPTGLMRLRFIAEDLQDPSLVEAAVDDLQLLSFTNGTTAVSETPGPALSFSRPSPNPSRERTRFRFQLPIQEVASLAIYDLSGRRVRQLAAGLMAAGPHESTWDGKDEDGAAMASGLYFARLDTPAGTLTQRVVRSR